MATESQPTPSKPACRTAALISDKWMLLLFPVITLTLFMVGLIGIWSLASFVFPLLFGA